MNRTNSSGTLLKSYTYDNNGNCTSVFVPGTGTTTLTYNWADKVTGITYPGNQTNSFVYNGLGLRVSKTDNTGPGYTPRTYTARTDGADPASPLLFDGYTVYTPGISERPVGGATTFYHLDALGSVAATTNAGQQQTTDVRYSAFGTEQSYNGSLNTFGWNGKSQYQKDRESGLMLLGHRYYDQSTGRFLSEDPARDGANWYAYCANNPLTAVDPSGLTKKDNNAADDKRKAIIIVGDTSTSNKVSQAATDWAVNRDVRNIEKEFTKSGYDVSVLRNTDANGVLAALKDTSVSAVAFIGHYGPEDGSIQINKNSFVLPEDLSRALEGRYLERAIAHVCNSAANDNLKNTLVGPNGRFQGSKGYWWSLGYDLGKMSHWWPVWSVKSKK